MSIDALVKHVKSLNCNVCVEVTDNYVRVMGEAS